MYPSAHQGQRVTCRLPFSPSTLGFWARNSDGQAWQQVPLLTEPSSAPFLNFNRRLLEHHLFLLLDFVYLVGFCFV